MAMFNTKANEASTIAAFKKLIFSFVIPDTLKCTYLNIVFDQKTVKKCLYVLIQ